MSASRLDAIALAGRLVKYPRGDYASDLRAFGSTCRALGCNTAPKVEGFAADVMDKPLEALQELYAQNFDMTADCALEVGWHLFGEDYQRGVFMVRMRQQLRDHGIDEGGELPDHLASLLALVVRLDSAHARTLIADALMPCVDRIRTALAKGSSPFHTLFDTLHELLAAQLAEVAEVPHG